MDNSGDAITLARKAVFVIDVDIDTDIEIDIDTDTDTDTDSGSGSDIVFGRLLSSTRGASLLDRASD